MATLVRQFKFIAMGLVIASTSLVTGLSASAAETDGTPDLAFAAAVSPTLNNEVYAISVQTDGSIVVGGNFGGAIARFSSAGTPDTTSTRTSEALPPA